MSTPPSLPTLSIVATLAIFAPHTPESLQDGQTGTLSHYSIFGRDSLGLAMTEILMERQPVLTGERMAELRTTFLSDDMLFYWFNLYGFRAKVRTAPGPERLAELDNPAVTRHYFQAYMGAIALEYGQAAVKSCLKQLVRLQLAAV